VIRRRDERRVSDSSPAGRGDVEAVHGPLEPAARQATDRLAIAATRVDGWGPFSEQTRLAFDGTGPGVTHLLRRGAGAVVGYAQVDAAGITELAVHPAHRRTGHGRALLKAAAGVAGESLRVWSYAAHPAAPVLAAAVGLEPVRELHRMRAALPVDPARDPAGEVPLPAGVGIRTFVPGRDEAAWLACNAAAFANHPEQGRVSLADLEARERADWFDPAGFFLAERTGQLMGFHWTKVHTGSGSEPPSGEVYVLGVRPEAHGGGLGRALLRIGLRHLADSGLPGVLLYVDGHNAAAVRLYHELGFKIDWTAVMYGRPGRPDPGE